MIAGPTVNLCDGCVDIMTDVVAEERKQSTITRSARLTPELMHPATVLLSGFAEHLRARNPAEDVVLAIRRDGSMIGMEVRHATGRGEVVASALADHGLIVTGASEAGPAERRVLDAARAALGSDAPPDAGASLARELGGVLSNATTLVLEVGQMAVQAQDAGVREALDAVRDALERGFGAEAEAEMRARLTVIGAADFALVARIGEVAARGGGRERRRAARALDRGAAGRRLTVRRGGRAGRRPPGGRWCRTAGAPRGGGRRSRRRGSGSRAGAPDRR